MLFMGASGNKKTKNKQTKHKLNAGSLQGRNWVKEFLNEFLGVSSPHLCFDEGYNA